MPMPDEITPHALRRTWANFAAAAGRTPKWIAEQIGHEDPDLAFRAYQQMGRRRYIDEAAIWSVMWFADEPEEARGAIAAVYECAHECAHGPDQTELSGILSISRNHETSDLEGFSEAAEGTRTLDLLHGKQTL